MPHDPEAFADMVVTTVKLAMAPVLADVKALQTQIAGWESRWNDLGTLRERVAVVEAKASTPPPVVEPEPVDLAPVLERLTSAETLLKAQGDLRDRVLVMETKAAASPPAPVLERAVDFTPVEQRLSKLEVQYEIKAAELAPLKESLIDLTKDVGAMRERLAVVETRPPVPGPAGEPGPPGKDGADGKDGAPGLSFEGVYQEGHEYEKGQLVTWAGSSWHCNNSTSTKPGETKDWTLMVKRGRDGKDGRDGVSPSPVVSIGSAR